MKMCNVVGVFQCLEEHTTNPCPKEGCCVLLCIVGTALLQYTGIIQNMSWIFTAAKTWNLAFRNVYSCWKGATLKIQDLLLPQCCWKLMSSGMWCCVTEWVVPSAVEERSAFVFRVKETKQMVCNKVNKHMMEGFRFSGQCCWRFRSVIVLFCEWFLMF
jgi:hypothetical protein